MTLIEILDASPIENMLSLMALRPDRLIFIGEEHDIREKVPAYVEFAERKHYKAEITTISAGRARIESVLHAIECVLEGEDDCVFDITGGDDVGLVAIGMALERFGREKHLRLHKFDIEKSAALCVLGVGEDDMPYKGGISISVDDNIRLYGGEPIYPSNELADPSKWALTENVMSVIDSAWELCRMSPKQWNGDVGRLKEFERFRSFVDDPMRVVITAKNSSALKNRADKLSKNKRFLERLSRRGLIRAYRAKNGETAYTYSSAYAKHCLEKAGNILEIKILALARLMKNEDGTPFFSDAKTAVSIDWRGEARYGVPTFNEIDALLMRGLVPIFVSCKNGGVGDDELYKLNTVAEHFGGRYAKKILIMSDTPKSAKSMSYFLSRAEDMNITVINDVCEMSDEAIMKRLRQAVTGRL